MVNAVCPAILEMWIDMEQAYSRGRERAWCALPTLKAVPACLDRFKA